MGQKSSLKLVLNILELRNQRNLVIAIRPTFAQVGTVRRGEKKGWARISGGGVGRKEKREFQENGAPSYVKAFLPPLRPYNITAL